MKAPCLLTKARRALFFCVCALCLSLTGHAYSQVGGQQPQIRTDAQQSIALSPEQALSLVSQLIIAGSLADAEKVLSQIRGRTNDPEQEQFLAAQIAIRNQDYAKALGIYDDLLAKNTELIRIRIERARLLAAMGQVDKANAEFAAIRRSDLSDGLSNYVDRLLAATRQSQPWTLSLIASTQYDSNASAGPDQETVTLFGLPFTLSPDARARAAWGANVSASGSYRWSLSETWAIRATGGLSHTEVEQDQFDDSLATAQVTLGRSSSNSVFAVGPTAYRRWFGGSGLSASWGVQGVVEYRLNSRWQVAAVASLEDVSYDLLEERDGVVSSATVRATQSTSPSSAFLVYGGIAHEGAGARPLRNTIYRLGAAYAYRLTSGVRITARPEIAMRDFEGTQPAFGAKRKDWRYSAGLDIKTPSISETGIAPFVSYSFVKNDSSIDFNSYTRHQVRFGIAFEL